MENIKIEEKIDFIYKRLKLEEKREKRKIFFKIFHYFLITLIIFLWYFWGIKFITNSIKNTLTENISSKTEDIKENFSNFYDWTLEKIKNFNNNINY